MSTSPLSSDWTADRSAPLWSPGLRRLLNDPELIEAGSKLPYRTPAFLTVTVPLTVRVSKGYLIMALQRKSVCCCRGM